eukprot:gene3212-6343_t
MLQEARIKLYGTNGSTRRPKQQNPISQANVIGPISVSSTLIDCLSPRSSLQQQHNYSRSPDCLLRLADYIGQRPPSKRQKHPLISKPLTRKILYSELQCKRNSVHISNTSDTVIRTMPVHFLRSWNNSYFSNGWDLSAIAVKSTSFISLAKFPFKELISVLHGLTGYFRDAIDKRTGNSEGFDCTCTKLLVLRQTKALDSDTSEACFDRYTSLAARIFNVPTVLISLVDIDRQWFKSRVCLGAPQTHRNDAFCAYVVLPESPDVFVVLNAEQDERFRQNPLVTGPLHIRFYAGAALIVDNIKIGTLCLIDYVPHTSFSLEDKMNLMDLSASVAHILAERRAANINIEKQQSQMLLSFSHNLRTPLTCLTMGLELLQSNANNAIKSNPELSLAFDNNHFQSVHKAVGQLKFLVESTLKITELNGKRSMDGEDGGVTSNEIIPKLLQKAKSMASILNKDCKITWNLNGINTSTSTTTTTCILPQLDTFFFILLNILSLVVPDAISIEMIGRHVKVTDDGIEVEVESKTKEQYESQPWKLFNIKKALSDINGSHSFHMNSNCCNFSFSIPCEIITQIIDNIDKFDDSNNISAAVSSFQKIPSDSSFTSTSEKTRNSIVNVLIVEDSIPIQKVMKSFLRGKGCNVLTAVNGKEGLEALKQKHFDVVFTDFLMPVMDGVTMTKMWNEFINNIESQQQQQSQQQQSQEEQQQSDIQQSYTNKSTTLYIGMSATASPPELSQAFDHGMMFFCPKPICMNILTSIVNIVISTDNMSQVRSRIKILSYDSSAVVCNSRSSQIASASSSIPSTAVRNSAITVNNNNNGNGNNSDNDLSNTSSVRKPSGGGSQHRLSWGLTSRSNRVMDINQVNVENNLLHHSKY